MLAGQPSLKSRVLGVHLHLRITPAQLQPPQALKQDPFQFLGILCLGMASDAPTLNHTLDVQWEEWKTKHNKTYSKNEEGQRRAIWENNLKMIELHNEEYIQGKHDFTLAMNAFGDMTNEEFSEQWNGFGIQKQELEKVFQECLSRDVSNTVDSREEGDVTPVDDEETCDSCCAFSETGALEGQLYRKTDDLFSVSEQNLLDCSSSQGDGDCTSRQVGTDFQDVKDNRGQDTEESQPYEGKLE
ncbi:procathepsin L-like isoform X2 [Castor canadensis]|uniref:Procathepsin L-like isoform X2 n=1 Tax=Castor canadensis TaxID=51338 RepID=A0AC58KUX1_CASCN